MSETQNKECLMCGIKISETNYYPAFDLEQNKGLDFCCRECFERYAKFEEMVRKNVQNKSCKYCKHFLEIPQKLSLGDLQQEYLRFCVISGLHEPIDDTWELEHELCFVRKESENAENKG